MFKRLSQWLQPQAAQAPVLQTPLELALGQSVMFADTATVPSLRAKQGRVIRRRIYLFADERLLDYVIKLEDSECEYVLSLRQEEDLSYIGVSRELSSAEKTAWFDPDALSFFLEESSAKTIRCRANSSDDQAWAADRYTKSVDLVAGTVMDADKKHAAPSPLLYSMLLSQYNEKAIEIEQHKEHGLVRLYATVFMPSTSITFGDIQPNHADQGLPMNGAAPEETVFIEKDDSANAAQKIPVETKANDQPRAQIIPIHDAFDSLSKALIEEQGADDAQMLDMAVLNGHDDEAIAAEEVPSMPEPRASFKNDFRRLDLTEKAPDNKDYWPAENSAPLPEFLLEPKYNADRDHALFQQIFAPSENQIVCDGYSADALRQAAKARGLSVQDLVRDTVGLNSKTSQAVHIDLPLSEEDYKKLAMRYHIKPDKKEEIRRRVSEELMQQIIAPGEKG